MKTSKRKRKHNHAVAKQCSDANARVTQARAGLIPSEETDNARVNRAEFTHQEWDTVLAALRLWQQDRQRIESFGMDSNAVGTMEYAQWHIATEHGDALTNTDVDQLCERINCSPDSPSNTRQETWALFSDDDGVALFDTEAQAKKTAKAWDKAGANDLSGPYGPFKSSPNLLLPIAVVIGGVLQGVFHPVLDAKTEEDSTVELAYDLVDFDVLEGNSDEDIANYWNNLAASTQKYYKKFHPADAKKFTDAVRRHKRAQRTQTGRIRVPKGKTANDRAKERAK